MKRTAFFLSALIMILTIGWSVASCKDFAEEYGAGIEVNKSILDELEETAEGAQGIVNIITEMQLYIDILNQKIEELQGAPSITREEIEELIVLMTENLASKEELEKVRTELQTEVDATNALLQSLGDRTDVIEDSISSYAQRLLALEALSHQAASSVETVSDLLQRVEQLEIWKAEVIGWQSNIEQWKASVDAFIDRMADIPEKVEKALRDAEAAMTQATINAQAIEELKLAQDSIMNSYGAAIDSINLSIQELYTIIELLVDTTFNGSYEDLKNEINTNFASIEAKLAEHEKKINENIEKIALLNSQYETLRDEMDNVQDFLNHLITGIILQGSYNPVYGLYSPVNQQNPMLATYYGDISTPVKFPSTDSRNYSNPSVPVLSAKDMEMLGGTSVDIPSGRVVNESADNAGIVYLTINPTNIDFAGAAIGLVNSKNKPATVNLSPLKSSDKKLTARSIGNGFYEMTASVSAADIDKVTSRFDLSEFSSDFERALTPANGASVTGVIDAILKNLNYDLDANALKASWTVNDKEMAVYSDYKLSQTAIRPLSYRFFLDHDIQQINGLGSAENFINMVGDEIQVTIADDPSKYQLDSNRKNIIKKISHNGDAASKLIATADITLEISAKNGTTQKNDILDIYNNGAYVTTTVIDANEASHHNVSKTIEVRVDISHILQHVNADAGSLVKNINKELSSINSILQQGSQPHTPGSVVDNAAGDQRSELINFFEKAEGTLGAFVNSPHKALQPLMLIKTHDTFVRVSETQKAPTQVSGTQLHLIPTSYTADVAAPAYKRLVGVTNVYTSDYSGNAQDGDSSCLEELRSLNSQPLVGEVTDGAGTSIPVSIRKGYVYEFTYTAVDYAGYIVCGKCYLTAGNQ